MTVKTTRYDVEIIPTPRLGVSLKISENTFGLSGAEPLVGWGKGEGRGEGGALGFSLDTIFLSVNKKKFPTLGLRRYGNLKNLQLPG